MYEFRLLDNVYVAATPAGAYHATSYPDAEPARKLLTRLLQSDQTQPLAPDQLRELLDDEEQALELVYRAQSVGWIEGEAAPRTGPDFDMETDIPPLLGQLSGSGKALLADADGFYLARSGINHETAEELSALSADVATLQNRHRGLLDNNLRTGSSAWSVVDAAGHTRVGIWPLWVGEHRFALSVIGQPRLNQPAYRDLVWALFRRYRRQ